jgi:hypothetical protein
VLATIRVHRLSERYAAYACAMFCSKRAYSEFVEARRRSADSSTVSTTDPIVLHSAAVQDWPEHRQVATELSHYGGDPYWSSGSDHSGHYGDWGGGHDTGGGSYDGGGGGDGGGGDGGGGGGSD